MWITWRSATLLTPERPTKLLFLTARSKPLLVSAVVVFAFSMSPFLRSTIAHFPLRGLAAHQQHLVRILSSTQSVTGLVVVGEGVLHPDSETQGRGLHSIRYLRASHSILGGVWIGHEIRVTDMSFTADEQGMPLGDSIYSAFVLQEAARLVNSTPKGKEEKWENALIMYDTIVSVVVCSRTLSKWPRNWYLGVRLHAAQFINHDRRDRSCRVLCGKTIFWYARTGARPYLLRGCKTMGGAEAANSDHKRCSVRYYCPRLFFGRKCARAPIHN